MNDGMTIRDPDEMIRFANEVDQYCAEMKKVCNDLKADLLSAAPTMKDRVSRKALQRTEILVETLLEGLPGVEEASELLKKSAKPLIQSRMVM